MYRVHLVSNDFSLRTGGAERVVRWLHEGLRDRGIDSRLIGLAEAPDASPPPASQYLSQGSPWSLQGFLELRRYLAKEVLPSDIVHVHLFPTQLFVALASLGTCSPTNILTTEHSTFNRRRNTWWGRLLDRVVYDRFGTITCISEGARDALVEHIPFAKARCRTVYNGAPLVHDEPLDRVGRDGPVRIVSVGFLDKRKNYENMIRAIHQLGDLEVEYHIAGPGPDEELLRNLAASLGLSERVRFHGFVEDTEPLYREADIFLLASSWEGFGLAAVEAMNATLPCVVSDVGGLREVVGKDQDCAFLVDPLNPQDIASRLRLLIESQALRTRMGKQGFLRARRFGLGQMVDRYLCLYGEVLGRAQG